MKRFNFDDEEETGFDGEDGLTPEDYKRIVEEEMSIQRIQLGLATRDLNQRLMSRVVKSLESSFWWRFYSFETRLSMIQRAYRKMKKLSEE